MTTLSPATETTCTTTGFARFGNLIDQPVVSAVAVNRYVTSVLSLVALIPFTFHFPATSPSLSAGGAGGGAGVAAAGVVSAGLFSDFAQPTIAAAQHRMKMGRIGSSRWARFDRV